MPCVCVPTSSTSTCGTYDSTVPSVGRKGIVPDCYVEKAGQGLRRSIITPSDFYYSGSKICLCSYMAISLQCSEPCFLVTYTIPNAVTNAFPTIKAPSGKTYGAWRTPDIALRLDKKYQVNHSTMTIFMVSSHPGNISQYMLDEAWPQLILDDRQPSIPTVASYAHCGAEEPFHTS